MTTGQCLCSAVRFSLSVKPRFFYRCHCSLCRRQTGVGHNLATLVGVHDFHWEAGQDSISSWVKPSGYRNDFCADCGSTVPNPLRGSPYVWVPLGLLDNDLSLECAGDFCVDDAMSWDAQRSANYHHGSVESLAFLVRELRVDAD